jgi:ABC-2 type transport system ATP-binding protein
MNYALEAVGLCKVYERPRVEALRGVDFRVSVGTCVGVLGPNGSGKTTLIEIMQGVRQPTSGSVSIFGLNFTNDEAKIRTKIGGVLQENGTWLRVRVREILALFGSLYAHPLAFDYLTTRFRLESLLGRPLEALSGGERQRVFLALAVIGNPELIFLDEPTTGLDPRSRRDFWKFILDLKAEGRSIVLTTHYLEEAEVLCDEVTIVKEGSLIARGTPAELCLRAARSVDGGVPKNLNEVYLAITDDGEK